MALENAVASLIVRANENLKVLDGDYFDEHGLLMCGKCNTPKQTIIEMPYGKQIVCCMCKCQTEKFNAVHEKLRWENRLDDLRAKCYPDPVELREEYLKMTLENDDGSNPELRKAVTTYIDGFDGYCAKGVGVLFHGRTGRGKTYRMCQILNALMDEGRTAKFTSFTAIGNELMEIKYGRQDYLNSYARFDVLAIDDLDEERNTEFMQSVVYSVIDARVTSRKPLLLTTNLSGADMAAEQDISKRRVYSRIYEACIPIEVKGPDKRLEKLKTRKTQFTELTL